MNGRMLRFGACRERTLATIAVAIGAALLVGGCIPPPGQPSAAPWSVAAGCKTGTETEFGSTSQNWVSTISPPLPRMGSLRMTTQACWDGFGKVAATTTSLTCTPASGYSVSRKIDIIDNLRKNRRTGLCEFVGGGRTGAVTDQHDWSTHNFHDLLQESCARVDRDLLRLCDAPQPGIPPAAGGRYIPYWYDARPPAPPLPDRRVQGRRLPTGDTKFTFARLTLDGNDVPTSDGTGGFDQKLSAGSHVMKVYPPDGYYATWTICINKTSCHGDKTPTVGDTIAVNPEAGKYWDVQWTFKAGGIVKGYKELGLDTNTRGNAFVRSMNVYMDGVPTFFQPDYGYKYTHLAPGWHTVSVDDPATHYVGYTFCEDNRCHYNQPTWTNSLGFIVEAGHTYTLWWHYYAG